VDETLHRRAPGLIAIGASAGGIEALQRLMRDLPEDLAAAVCVVLHIPASSRSLLAEIIDRQTPLPVTPAVDGEAVRPGHVYVAPPDCHLRIAGGRTRLDRGPKENGVRPAVDPLFRSAAVAAAGGAVLVQDFEDAVVPSMPTAARAAVPDAPLFTAHELAAELARRAAALPAPESEEGLASVEENRPTLELTAKPDGPPSGLTCPECHGPLWERRNGQLVHYRCRVGHVYAQDVLVEDKAAAVETALWMAVEALEERTELLVKVADRLAAQNRDGAARRTRERARAAAERAELIRGTLGIDDETSEDVAAGAS
jgi:two-component system chemotaxis response regulator CheB